jgi:excisionase family DNA binding protein
VTSCSRTGRYCVETLRYERGHRVDSFCLLADSVFDAALVDAPGATEKPEHPEAEPPLPLGHVVASRVPDGCPRPPQSGRCRRHFPFPPRYTGNPDPWEAEGDSKSLPIAHFPLQEAKNTLPCESAPEQKSSATQEAKVVKPNYRIEEVAAFCGQSYRAVRDAIARGQIASVRVGVRGVRIPASEVERLTSVGAQPQKTAPAGSVA